MLEKAIQWIKRNTIAEKGVVITSLQRKCYPEVTGYLIPTLLAAGERALADQYARWLISIQHADGAFGPEGATEAFAFDTGQVIRGLVARVTSEASLEKPLRRACEWLVNSSDPVTGRLPVPHPGSAWNLGRRGEIGEAVHLYVLAPLRRAGEILNERRYTRFVDHALNYYLKLPGLTDFRRPNALTHLFAYVQEALLDLNCEDEARKGMASAAIYQQPNGAVPGYSDVHWVCSTGLAQLALVWYRLGETERADLALKFLGLLQNPGGGFLGSYGPGADYFAAEEISWAVKFTADASQARIRAFFDREAQIFPEQVSPADGRLLSILEYAGDLQGRRVLDVGCGKGRFAAAIQSRFPGTELYGLDISEELLRCVPAGIRTYRESMLHMPFEDSQFDVVYCVEALEHAVRIDAAVAEMYRVLRPGGEIVIIDKNAERWGAMQTPDWEQWFTPAGLTSLLQKHGEAGWQYIAYDRQAVPDGLFVVWHGRKSVSTNAAAGPANASKSAPADPQTGGLEKRSTHPNGHRPHRPSTANAQPAALDAAEWHEHIVAGSTPEQIAARIRSEQQPRWVRQILALTRPGDRVLELGSGTGELSAILAAQGRQVGLLDYSQASLDFSAQVFEKLGLRAEFILADITCGLPFQDEAMDVVWSSGVLEHFDDETIVRILGESSRIARRAVISLVPNARSLPYRIGKWLQERSGQWSWGYEDPKPSMAPYYNRAGFVRVEETTLGARHSLQFMIDEALRHAVVKLRDFYDSLSEGELESLGQGYLLSSVGYKSKPRRLAVVPSDPLEAYESAGYGSWLEEYYNPGRFFSEVYCLSPVETRSRFSHGMQVIPTRPEELLFRLRELHVDLVRAYGGYWPCDFVTGAQAAGIPVIVSVHDSRPELLHDSIRQADRVIVMSRAVHDLVVSRGVDPGKVDILPNRIDFQVFHPLDDPGQRAAFEAKFPGKYRLVHIGRKAEQKNLDGVIRALAHLGPHYAAIFIGKGETAPYQELAQACGVEGQCHFIESVPNAELAQYYSYADCMCTPSRWEGFGIVFIEALACEAVVVTSDVGPMNEYIRDGENGLLVKAYEDPAALAEAIRRACTDQEARRALKGRARSSVEAFRKETVDHLEQELYTRYLGEKAP